MKIKLITRRRCGHFFHKDCVIPYKNTCPSCKLVCSVGSLGTPKSQAKQKTHFTRSTGKTNQTASNSANIAAPSGNSVSQSADNSRNTESPDLQNIVAAAVGAQQSQMFASLSDVLSRLIEEKISQGFQNLASAQQNHVAMNDDLVHLSENAHSDVPPAATAVQLQTLEQLLGLRNDPNTSARRENNITPGSGSQFNNELVNRPDKVSHIISNWKLRFSGASNSMSVENFIYRVEALTKQTLNRNFDLLCKNASLLFEGKACDWFWRYHKTVVELQWRALCEALKNQYKETATDVDFRERIRDRKQKPNETFDAYYEAVAQLLDRLSEPISEPILVEILRRNLLPEIQHECLNLKITSVCQLREICRRRETFLSDLRNRHGSAKLHPLSKRIAEMYNGESDDESSKLDEEIEAIALICWNCGKNGHRYQDCLSERKIFCYSCGTPNEYKPTCWKCNKLPKNGLNRAQISARKPISSKETKAQATNTD